MLIAEQQHIEAVAQEPMPKWETCATIPSAITLDQEPLADRSMEYKELEKQR